ncbi:MAG: methyltransferase, partial [Bacteroidota bacterium]
MEKLEQCNVCGKSNFSNYLQGRDYFLTQEEFTIVKCDECGFLFVNPRPDVNEISKYYKSEEYISHSNTKKGVLNKVYHIIR